MGLMYILSPAKTLDFSMVVKKTTLQSTTPKMVAQANELVQELRKMTQEKLKQFLNVSNNIAAINYERYQQYNFKVDTTQKCDNKNKQAVLAFDGPAYQGLNAKELSVEDLEYSQKHLRILCGLYGILRPLDQIQPYRLEMGSKLKTKTGGNLYDYWGTKLSLEIADDFKFTNQIDMTHSENILLNVASEEYSKSISQKLLEQHGIQFVTCVFKDGGRIVSVYAKRARGLMCRYLITNRINSLEGVKGFHLEGYRFSEEASDHATLVFVRTKEEAVKRKSDAPKLVSATTKRSKKN